MPGTGRWVTVGVTLSVLLAGRCVAVAATERPAVVLHLDDRAGVPPRDLERARVEIERVFREASVEIEWAQVRVPESAGAPDATGGQALRVSVMLFNRSGEVRGDAEGCVLGFAAPRHNRAFVFYNRVVDKSRTLPVDADVVLGRVIAHEIGHLLLAPGGHSSHGIMRPDLDFGFTNPSRFTDDQARKIRALLVDAAATTDVRR